MKNILVTGGAGFIGSAFVRHMVEQHPELNIIVLDLLTYAGNLNNLLTVSDEPNYRFVQGDVVSRDDSARVLKEYDVDTVVNFAAESHVDRSIMAPDAFIHSNTVGVHILLDESCRAGVERFLQVSTDEVYGDVAPGCFSGEEDRFLPNSPYAASKAAAELLVRACHVTHGLDTVVTRGSNTFGPYQYPEKLMPFFITEAIDERPLPLYGDGCQQRDWLHVDDHARGIACALFHGEPGQAYNIAGEHQARNLEVTQRILELLERPAGLIRHVADREGHDLRYAMRCERLKALGWRREHSFNDAAAATVRWYLENEWWWRPLKSGDWDDWYRRQYSGRLAAAEG